MLFFEDFLCGSPYEVYPTPAKGKDGGYIVYARPAKGLKISIEGVDEFCAKHYQTRSGEIEWATLVSPGTRPLGNGSMTDSKFSARKLLNAWTEGDNPKLMKSKMGHTDIYTEI